MLNGVLQYLKSLIPQRKEEEILLDTHNIIETLFLLVLGLFRKIARFKLERKGDSTVGIFLIDLGVIFSFLGLVPLMLCNALTLIFPEDPARNFYFLEIFVISFFISISWTGFVYLNHNFRNLIGAKILSIQIDYERSSDQRYHTFIRQYFNGTCLKWKSGREFRVHLRSATYLLFIIIFGLKIFCEPFLQFLLHVFTNYSIELAVILLILYIFTFILCSLFFLIIWYVLFSVALILSFLFGVSLDIPIEINPLLEMGGTKEYGNIIIKSIYLASFSIASIPLLLAISKLGAMGEIEIVQLTSQTFGNLTSELRYSLVNSIGETSINNLLTYSSYLIVLFSFIILSIMITVLLHDRIKQRKMELIQRIESQITSVDFIQTDNQNDRDRRQYLLDIYEKTIRSSEWPIKKTFVIELIISALPIIISYLL